MKYSEAIQYMYEALPMFHRQGKSAFKKDLDNIKALCNALGNPQNHLKCFHVAGTNGKGSVSHMLAAVLQANGYKTGLYVSPHYKDFRERIKINGEYISRSFVCNFIVKNKILFDEIKPSFFEMTVALAFSWFRFQNVNYAVIETGLGGRLDSTNIIEPILSIITNISWDHSDMLGDTLEKIAVEKAGIIKHKIPVLIGRKQVETKQVFKAMSEKLQCDLNYAEDLSNDFQFRVAEFGITQLSASVLGIKKNIRPSLNGNYQIENIRTVLAASELIHEYSFASISTDQIVYALEHTTELTHIIGRWQMIGKNPLIICESAHNEDGIRFLKDQLVNMKYNQLHIVCGFVKDKPLDAILSLLPKTAKYYFVKAKLPRALNQRELQRMAIVHQLFGKPYSSVRRGLAYAKKNAKKNDLILITGSIFVVGEVL